MRWGLALLLITAAQTGFGQAGRTLTLAWDPSPDLDVAGYFFYWGTASGQYTTRTNVGNATTNTISGLVAGVTYFFAVTAYSSTDGLESPFSDEISYTPPVTVVIRSITPAASAGPTISWESVPGAIYRVAYKDRLNDSAWTDLSADIPAAGPTTAWTDPTTGKLPARFYAVRRVQ